MVTNSLLKRRFLSGEGVIDVANRYKLPLTTVENALRVALKKDAFQPPVQMTIDHKEQMSIAEVYGEITI
jgi:hypothetical protein